jgi:hypothetical protein
MNRGKHMEKSTVDRPATRAEVSIEDRRQILLGLIQQWEEASRQLKNWLPADGNGRLAVTQLTRTQTEIVRLRARVQRAQKQAPAHV